MVHEGCDALGCIFKHLLSMYLLKQVKKNTESIDFHQLTVNCDEKNSTKSNFRSQSQAPFKATLYCFSTLTL